MLDTAATTPLPALASVSLVVMGASRNAPIRGSGLTCSASLPQPSRFLGLKKRPKRKKKVRSGKNKCAALLLSNNSCAETAACATRAMRLQRRRASAVEGGGDTVALPPRPDMAQLIADVKRLWGGDGMGGRAATDSRDFAWGSGCCSTATGPATRTVGALAYLGKLGPNVASAPAAAAPQAFTDLTLSSGVGALTPPVLDCRSAVGGCCTTTNDELVRGGSPRGSLVPTGRRSRVTGRPARTPSPHAGKYRAHGALTLSWVCTCLNA